MPIAKYICDGEANLSKWRYADGVYYEVIKVVYGEQLKGMTGDIYDQLKEHWESTQH